MGVSPLRFQLIKKIEKISISKIDEIFFFLKAKNSKKFSFDCFLERNIFALRNEEASAQLNFFGSKFPMRNRKFSKNI